MFSSSSNSITNKRYQASVWIYIQFIEITIIQCRIKKSQMVFPSEDSHLVIETNVIVILLFS